MKENSTSSFSKISLIFIVGISVYYAFKVTNFKKEIRSVNESNIISEDSIYEEVYETIHYNIVDTMAIEIKEEEVEELQKFIYKKFNFKENNYLIDISGEKGIWGECLLSIHKNGEILIKEEFDLWEGNVQDFKIENGFCYFAIPRAGGANNNYYVNYYCFDSRSEKIYKIEYNCNFSFDYCDYPSLSNIENNEEVYKFMKANIRIPVKDDNYFNTSAD